MSVVTWSPFRELEDVLNRYAGIRHNPLNRRDENKGLTAADWIPSVDIREQKDAYYIKAELPGVSKEDVKLTLEQGLLTIRGEKRFQQTGDEGKTHRVECSYGQFVRSFTLPESVQEDNVKASYKEGVLSLHIPKVPQAQPKAINIIGE